VGQVFSDRQRTDTRHKSGESDYAFYDRAAGPFWDRVRLFVEDMVARYRSDSLAGLVGRLKSGRENDFQGAIWELLVHDTLLGLGFAVTCHPDIPGMSTHPDFLAESGDCSLYIEATVLGEDKGNIHQERLRSRVYEEIDERVRSYRFWVDIEFDQDGHQTPPFGPLARALEAWLERLEDGGPSGGEGYSWSHEPSGWRLTFRPFTKGSSMDDDRVIHTGGVGEAHIVNDRVRIRKAIKGKARNYGTALHHPLVVALGLFRDFSDDTDVMDALYGDVVYTNGLAGGPAVRDRAPNGVWTASSRHQKLLSAVVTCKRPEIADAAQLSPQLWPNPWADLQIPCEPPSMRVITLGDEVAKQRAATVPHRHLLGLPQAWPGPEPPFPPRT